MFFPRLRNSCITFYVIGVLTGLIASYFMIKMQCRWAEALKFSRPRVHSVSREVTRDAPIVFVGGHPRSGTTLMRVLLDAHPSFHCGQETHIIPDLLTLRRKYSRGRNSNRLREAGLDLEVTNVTIAQSILEFLKSRRVDSKRICAKDPFTLKHISYLARMFPNAQFILMVRDVRAVIHSIYKNKIKISNFPIKDIDVLRRWDKIVEKMFKGCFHIGRERCKVVHYETLVLKSRSVLEEILLFLRSTWNENVMNHSEHLNRGGILLSRFERSTHQVRKPLSNNSLCLWRQSRSLNIPPEQLVVWAPMMDTLGYLKIGDPPEYAKLNMK